MHSAWLWSATLTLLIGRQGHRGVIVPLMSAVVMMEKLGTFVVGARLGAEGQMPFGGAVHRCYRQSVAQASWPPGLSVIKGWAVDPNIGEAPGLPRHQLDS